MIIWFLCKIKKRHFEDQNIRKLIDECEENSDSNSENLNSEIIVRKDEKLLSIDKKDMKMNSKIRSLRKIFNNDADLDRDSVANCP